MGFHGFWLVSIVFHSFWLVFMVFKGSFMVFHGFWLVSMVFKVVSWVFMVFGWFPWFFMVPGWFVMVPGWFFIVSPECTCPKLYPGPTIQSWSAARRAALDLVSEKNNIFHQTFLSHQNIKIFLCNVSESGLVLQFIAIFESVTENS